MCPGGKKRSGSACSLGKRRYWNFSSSYVELGLFPQRVHFEVTISMEKAGELLALPGLWHSVLGRGQWDGEQGIGENRPFCVRKTGAFCALPWGWELNASVAGSHPHMKTRSRPWLGSAQRLVRHPLCAYRESLYFLWATLELPFTENPGCSCDGGEVES